MPALNIRAAGAEGYTQAEIADYLGARLDRDVNAMREEGYSDAEIVAYLAEQDLQLNGPPRRAPNEPAPDNSASQWAQVMADALSPYAAAATMGGLAGAPLGGVGAIPGAAGGVLSLGLSDLGTSIYNAAAPMFGGEQLTLPSQTIRNAMRQVGVGRAPQTPAQSVVSQTVSGAAGAFGGASALGTLAQRVAPGVTQNVMRNLAQAPGTQAAAGAGASAAPAIANQYFGVQDPLALYGLSLGGGMAAGRAATPRPEPVTRQMLDAQRSAAYARADQAGVQFDPASIESLHQNILRSFTTHPSVQYDPALHSRIAVALNRISERAAEAQAGGRPVSFSEVDLLRRIARTAADTTDRSERRLGYQLIQQIDDFVDAPPPNAIVAGQGPEAASAIRDARQAYRRMMQADAIDMMISRAANSAGGLSAESLRTQARQVANNPNRMRAFDPAIQQRITDMARGAGGLAALQNIGRLAPSLDMRNPLTLIPSGVALTGTGTAFATGNPLLGALGASITGGAMAARGAANRMASNRMQNMVQQARGGETPSLPASAYMQTAMQAAVPAPPASDAIPANTVTYDPAEWDANGNYIGPVWERGGTWDENANYIPPSRNPR